MTFAHIGCNASTMQAFLATVRHTFMSVKQFVAVVTFAFVGRLAHAIHARWIAIWMALIVGAGDQFESWFTYAFSIVAFAKDALTWTQGLAESSFV